MQRRITEYLRENSAPIKSYKLARQLDLTKKQLKRFDSTVSELIYTGQIKTNKKGQLFLPDSPLETEKRFPSQHRRRTFTGSRLTGTIQRVANGAWFILDPELHNGENPSEAFIYPEGLADAQDNDRVEVRLEARRGSGNRRVARIEKVIERATHEFVGTYEIDGDRAFVRIDGTAIEKPVSVGDPGAKGAQPGDKVIVELVTFPTPDRAGQGVVVRILGRRGDPGVDTQSVLHEFGIPHEFPKNVLRAARQQADQFDETDLSGRVDLTKELIVTIDPVDARDFDDAISLKQSQDGHWHLGVHIADVAHFVKPGTPLDDEARRRGTSVYLPGQVVPMLPEVISNGLASLQQGRVRYTKSVLMEFSPSGTLLATDFANSAIEVKRRFAYEEIMPIVESPSSFKGKIRQDIRELVVRMHEFAMLLRQRRIDLGALELHLPEVKIELDQRGKVCGAHELHHDESHQMIEEFMLAANIAVATELSAQEQPCIRRIHGKPDSTKLQSLSDFVHSLGFGLQNPSSRFELQNLVEDVKGKPSEQAVNYALLRSMKQAEYSVSDEGHYALGVDHYCHFTSPIRRYPDLTIHRQIAKLAKLTTLDDPDSPTATENNRAEYAPGRRDRAQKAGTKPQRSKVGESPQGLLKTAHHCSLTERRAQKAERELVRVKLIELMSQHKETEFQAVISRVQRHGISCRCVKYPVDGFIPIRKLIEGDYLDYDRSTSVLVGRRTGRIFRLGDMVTVKVARADSDRRELDWVLADGPTTESDSTAKKSRKPRHARVAVDDDRDSSRRKPGDSQSTENKSSKRKRDRTKGESKSRKKKKRKARKRRT